MRTIQEILKSKKVLCKPENLLLYEEGIFGNKPLTWDSLEQIKKDGWKGYICIRARTKRNFETRYKLSIRTAEKVLRNLEKKGFHKTDFIFNQSMPDEYLAIQGEVMQFGEGYDCIYSKLHVPMKLAFKAESLHQAGMKTETLLKQNLSASSWEDLNILFEMFPHSIVEFSTYKINVGNLRGRNTIIWEVRNY